MTNYERISKANKEALAWFVASFEIADECLRCQYCNLMNRRDKVLNWLNQEIKLSSKERYTLEKLEKTYEWIAREKDGTLWAYEEEPVKTEDFWFSTQERYCLERYNDLFKFIQTSDAEPYNIKELLNQ